MLEIFTNWLKARGSSKRPPPKRTKRTVAHHPDAEFVETDDNQAYRIESNGPGKNVLIRKQFLREDTGTHETLKILDDSLVDSGEETGLDPYNTGGFDRSKNWDRRFGK